MEAMKAIKDSFQHASITLLAAVLVFTCCGCGAAGGGGGNPTPSAAHPEGAASSGKAGSGAPIAPLQSGEAGLTFLFFSDTQADPEAGSYQSVGERIAEGVSIANKQNLGLVIFGGDTVNDGGDEAEWGAFWREAGAPLAGLPIAAVAGNHDSHAMLAEQFDYPETAPAGRGDGFFYSFDMGPVHFIMLDSNIMGAARQADQDWLREDLESVGARKAGWRIAVMHHPLWPPVANPKDDARAKAMREHFLPVLEAHGVELVLCGHQHIYTRSAPMRGENVSADGGGIIQIMAASGDKQAYFLENGSFIEAAADSPNYLLITADSEKLGITAYNADNVVVDSCVLTKAAGG